MVQLLGLCVSTAGGMGSIPGRGTKVPHVDGTRERCKMNNALPAFRELLLGMYVDNFGTFRLF